MKIVKVMYTITADYAEKNKANIRQVMDDLQALHHPGIFYHACVGADGKTFIHTAFFAEEDNQKILFDLSSFKTFQEQLKANGFEMPPQQELLSLVGASTPIFKEH